MLAQGETRTKNRRDAWVKFYRSEPASDSTKQDQQQAESGGTCEPDKRSSEDVQVGPGKNGSLFSEDAGRPYPG